MAALLTRTQVCQLLGVSPKSLYLWERAGKIPVPPRSRRGWRAYSPADVAAIRRFLGLESESGRPKTGTARARVASRLEGLSARNQIEGTIASVQGDGVLCEVVLRLGDGQEISAVITRRSAERLALRKGERATAVIKATEVMIFR